MTTKAISEGYTTITSCITCKDAKKEMEFLKQAFGATERFQMACPETKRVIHAEMQVGSARIMLSDKNPDMGCKSAADLGGSPVGFYLYVQDVDAAFAKATTAGAKTKMPLADMFWGDRTGTVTCPEGYDWTVASHVKDLTPEQQKEAGAKFMAEMKKKASNDPTKPMPMKMETSGKR